MFEIQTPSGIDTVDEVAHTVLTFTRVLYFQRLR